MFMVGIIKHLENQNLNKFIIALTNFVSMIILFI